MSKLHAQMALFAAIDRALMHQPSLAPRVRGILPGATEPSQTGWSDELLDFMNAVHDDNVRAGDDVADGPIEFQTADQALAELVTPEPGEADQRLPTRPENPFVAGRALFALGTLQQVERLPDIPDNIAWEPITQTAPSGPDALDLLVTLTAPQQSPAQPPGLNVPPAATIDATTTIANALRGQFRQRTDFDNMMTAFSGTGIDKNVALTPECRPRLRRIKGGYTTVLTTDAQRPDVTIGQIKKIIDPWNWKLLAPSFFCNMEQRDSYRDWSRVREQVSTMCCKYRMDTELKYWSEIKKVKRTETELYLNYDLAEHRSDLGLVEVDNGYIWVTRLGPTGVRIRTGKQVRICGLSPTATAALACLAGWADAGNMMLADKALELTKAPAVKDLEPFSTPLPVVAKPRKSLMRVSATTRSPCWRPGWRTASARK